MGFLAVWSKMIILGSGVGVLRGADGRGQEAEMGDENK
jgi:hypothetical protein